jgi:A/G-specific adenine glycosylase
VLPWRGTRDPYRIWLSEIMLQQTRVNAVMDHYARFLQRFPTVVALALAPEADVLALWSGLGYYRRARMLHRTAKLVVEEHGGALPTTALDLRRLPGIGAYTSAAIASIAFGEQIAVVDGNVERVLLRVTGRPETPGAAAAEFINITAQALVPKQDAGDHNQAMMELGATVCLPRGPLCSQCPVYEECRTRGEHLTAPRTPMRSERVRYALTTRKAKDGRCRVVGFSCAGGGTGIARPSRHCGHQLLRGGPIDPETTRNRSSGPAERQYGMGVDDGTGQPADYRPDTKGFAASAADEIICGTQYAGDAATHRSQWHGAHWRRRMTNLPQPCHPMYIP